MAFGGRRIVPDTPRLVGRQWPEVTQELQEFLAVSRDSEDEGLPAGYSDETPLEGAAGGSGDAGEEESGWAAADHTHPHTVGTPVDVGLANAVGASGSFADAEHVHDLPVSVLLTRGVPVWTKYSKAHADLQAAALTNDIELLSLPAKSVIHAVYLKHSTAFAGAGITAYTLSVGVAADLIRYSLPQDVLQAIGNTVFLVTSAVGAENHGAAVSIRLAAVSVGANLDQSSAGAVDVWVLWSTLP